MAIPGKEYFNTKQIITKTRQDIYLIFDMLCPYNACYEFFMMIWSNFLMKTTSIYIKEACLFVFLFVWIWSPNYRMDLNQIWHGPPLGHWKYHLNIYLGSPQRGGGMICKSSKIRTFPICLRTWNRILLRQHLRNLRPIFFIFLEILATWSKASQQAMEVILK